MCRGIKKTNTLAAAGVVLSLLVFTGSFCFAAAGFYLTDFSFSTPFCVIRLPMTFRLAERFISCGFVVQMSIASRISCCSILSHVAADGSSETRGGRVGMNGDEA